MELARLRQDLALDEGRKLRAYPDTAAPPNWTIGVGHLLGSSPRMSEITDAECDALLNWDIDQAQELAISVVPDYLRLSEPRQRALVNMAFNRGGHMRTSTTIVPAINQAIIDGSWEKVAAAIRTSPWAQIVGARAERLAVAFEVG